MTMLFALFYFVPAIGAVGVAWAVWRLTRLLNLSLITRRVLFVILGTLAMAPMIVPAGTIYAAWVPHGLLMLTPDVEYYVRFWRYVVPSFVSTALVSSVVAMLCVRPNTPPLTATWRTIMPPLGVTMLVVVLYQYMLPSRSIPASIDVAAVEGAYGATLDDVAALLSINDPARQDAEVTRLHSIFDEDATVLRVSLEDPGLPYKSYGQTFYHLNAESPPSFSCSGTGASARFGLMRCTWSYGTVNRREVLRYVRSFDYDDETLEVVIEFDFEKALTSITR